MIVETNKCRSEKKLSEACSSLTSDSQAGSKFRELPLQFILYKQYVIISSPQSYQLIRNKTKTTSIQPESLGIATATQQLVCWLGNSAARPKDTAAGTPRELEREGREGLAEMQVWNLLMDWAG